MHCWVFLLLQILVWSLSNATSTIDTDLEKITNEVSAELQSRYSSHQLFSEDAFVASLVAIGRTMRTPMLPAIYQGTLNYLENGAEGLSAPLRKELKDFYSKADAARNTRFQLKLRVELGPVGFPLVWQNVLDTERKKYYGFLKDYEATLDELMQNVLNLQKMMPEKKQMAAAAAQKELALRQLWDLSAAQVPALIALSKKVDSVLVNSTSLTSTSRLIPGYLDDCQIGLLLVNVLPQETASEDVDLLDKSSSDSGRTDKPGKLAILFGSTAQINLVQVQVVGQWNGAAKKNFKRILKDLFWYSSKTWVKRVKRFELLWTADSGMAVGQVQKAVADAIGIEISLLNLV